MQSYRIAAVAIWQSAVDALTPLDAHTLWSDAVAMKSRRSSSAVDSVQNPLESGE
jgi:hypothetical protein